MGGGATWNTAPTRRSDLILQSAPGEIIADRHYYTFSSIAFYTGRQELLLNGRWSNLEYGSHAPVRSDSAKRARRNHRGSPLLHVFVHCVLYRPARTALEWAVEQLGIRLERAGPI